MPRRSQEERRSSTRAALLAAGRELFATRGFADVPAEQIVRTAGVTRGAMYHHFGDKTELFAAVFEQLEVEITDDLVDVARRRPGRRARADGDLRLPRHLRAAGRAAHRAHGRARRSGLAALARDRAASRPRAGERAARPARRGQRDGRAAVPRSGRPRRRHRVGAADRPRGRPGRGPARGRGFAGCPARRPRRTDRILAPWPSSPGSPRPRSTSTTTSSSTTPSRSGRRTSRRTTRPSPRR